LTSTCWSSNVRRGAVYGASASRRRDRGSHLASADELSRRDGSYYRAWNQPAAPSRMRCPRRSSGRLGAQARSPARGPCTSRHEKGPATRAFLSSSRSPSWSCGSPKR